MTDVSKAISQIKDNLSNYKTFKNYYDGRQRENFKTEKYIKQTRRFQTLKDNLCKAIVASRVDRLELINFASEKREVGTTAWELWQRNKMGLLATNVHREAFTCGDSYLIVWESDTPPTQAKRARFYPNYAANVTVVYDDETNEIEFAAKMWKTKDKFRLNLYYKDRIEKYISQNSNAGLPETETAEKTFEFITDDEAEIKNPYGIVPVFHFANEPMIDNFGLSVLTDVLPIQDALNKSLSDLFVAMEYNALRQRYAIGIGFEEDPLTGKYINPYTEQEQLWATDNPNAKFGEFAQSSLSEFLSVTNDLRTEFAKISGTPPHYFYLQTGSIPSGEALQTLESRFVSAIKNAQNSFGATWEKAMQFALIIEGNIDATDEITAQWTNADNATESETLTNKLLKQQLGVSNETLQAEIGYTEKQIADSKAQNAARQKNIGAELLKNFDAGTPDENV